MRMRELQVLLAAVAAAGCSATAAGAPAEWRRVVVVELFTSQGCSSCPAADAFLRDLPALGLGRDRIIPLAYHVDYWDGLGWKDPFASPDFTRRQRWYARSPTLRSPDGQTGIEGIYTPQLIVDGLVHLSGQRRQDAVREMAHAAARPPLFDLTADAVIDGSTVDLTVHAAGRADAPPARDWRLVVALVASSARTSVPRGENAGETLDEAAVVRALSERIPLPGGTGDSAALRLTKPAELSWSGIDVVGFVQSETTREIGGAFFLDRKHRAP